MPSPGGVFLSAVTSEFGRVRDEIRRDLVTKRFEVTVQEEFRQDGEITTLLGFLDDKVRGASAVVCIIGRRSGSLPSRQEMEPFAGLIPEGIGHPSYTQWELILAQRYDKPLYLFQASGDYVPDRPEPIGEDHPDLQGAFVEWLFDSEGTYRDVFSTAQDLRIRVLVTDFEAIPGQGHAGQQTDVGMQVDEQRSPRIRRKDPAEVHRLRKNRRALVGRADELEDVLAVIEDRYDNLVLLSGEEGIGRKAILQELAHHGDLPTEFEQGVGISPRLTGTEDGEEFRQAIWDEFFETDGPNTAVVGEKQRLEDLEGINALLLVPDIDPFIPMLPDLLGEMPDSMICASAKTDVADALREAGQAVDDVQILALSPDEMLELFDDLYRGDLPAAARDDVLALCTDLCEGNPARIEVLASEARSEARPPRRPVPGEPHPLIEWAARRRQQHERPVGASEDDSPASKQAIEAVKAAGTDVPRQVLVEDSESAEAVDQLVGDSRFEQGSPRYRWNPALDADPGNSASPVDEDAVLDRLFGRTVSWTSDASHAEMYENRGFVIRMMQWGLESGREILARDAANAVQEAHHRWRDVMRIGMAAEPSMAMGGRHGAWDRILQLVEETARDDVELSIGARSMQPDREHHDATLAVGELTAQGVLGWALHQRGSRSLLRNELKPARAHLTGSLRHRESERGRELTRRNMTLLPLAVIPFAALLLLPVFVASVVATQFLGFENSVATADITPDVLVFERDGPEEIRVRNVGQGPIWIADIDPTDDGDGAFVVLDPSDSALDASGSTDDVVEEPCVVNEPMKAGAECVILVTADERRATGELTVDVVSRSGEGQGDRSVVLISRP